LANHPSAWKRIRQNEKRRLRNKSIRSAVKTQIKKVLAAVERKDVEAAREALRVATSMLHKSVSKGVYHHNTAARKISRLTAKVNALAG
jgi:small subunit ribosomal protein S20